jgi:GNAT superfamily N-acetyltransferase
MLMSAILRNMRILMSRAKTLPLRDLAVLSMRAAFKTENVLVYCKDLDSPCCDPQKAQRSFMNIGKCAMSDLGILRNNMSNPSWEFLCDIYDGVKDCFVFKDHHGTINHISWLYYKGDPNRILRLGPKDVEIKYSLTLPNFRGKGIYTRTLIAIQGYVKAAGYRKVFISVDQHNLPSRRGIEKAGFMYVGRLKLIKFAGIQINKRFSASTGSQQ